MGSGKIVPSFSLNSFVAPKEDWYKNLNLQDSIDMAKEKMVAAAENFVAVGYYLKHIRDGELYKNKGYESIWECAKQELNLTQSTASRYISICEKFSSDGDSPYLGEKYKEYGKSQLQELLTISDQKLIEQVTPDMSVKQIQKLKRENKVEKDEHAQLGQTKEQTSENNSYAALSGQMQVVLDGTFRELESNERQLQEVELQTTETLPPIDAAMEQSDAHEEQSEAFHTDYEEKAEIKEIIRHLWTAVNLPYELEKDIVKILYDYASQDGIKSGVIETKELQKWLKCAEKIFQMAKN